MAAASLRLQNESDVSGSVAVPSKKLLGTNAVPGAFAPLKEHEAARRFSSIIIKIRTGTLAEAADRSKETVKAWRTKRQCPNLSSIINMARRLPTVKAWLMEECEKPGEPVPTKEQFRAALEALMEDASKPGPAGEYARSILSRRAYE